MTTETDACVLVTGIYPAFLDRQRLRQSVDQIKYHFDGYDIYYQSWDNPTNREILEPLGLPILWAKQPEVKVNPYEYLFELGWMNEEFQAKYKKLMTNKTQRLTNRTLQHLAHAAIVESLPRKYDIHIRTRWDVYISPRFDVKDWIGVASERPVGFAFTNAVKPDPWVRKKGRWAAVMNKRRKVRAIIDRGWKEVKRSAEDETDVDFWRYMIYDFVLMYQSDRFDPKRVYELHEANKLCPAEYGWYQLLNTNDNHINVNGLVGTRRLVDDDMDTLDRIRQAGEL